MTLWLRLRVAKIKATTMITNAAIIATGFMWTRVSMGAWMHSAKGEKLGGYRSNCRESMDPDNLEGQGGAAVLRAKLREWGNAGCSRERRNNGFGGLKGVALLA